MSLLFTENDRDKDDPVFLVSDMDDLLALIHGKRTQIEEGFRDLKSLFGFGDLVLTKPTQQRVELLFLVVIISMGLLFALFEKSGYKWSKNYNTSCRREFSLILLTGQRKCYRIQWLEFMKYAVKVMRFSYCRWWEV